MSTVRRGLSLALGAAAVGLVPAAVISATPGAASGMNAAPGTPGYCPTAVGVTVVVDFDELGGGIVVRCAPGPVVPGFTGVDALQGAGFSPEGVARWGLAFICRIAGKPAPDQTLPIDGNPGYQEACVNTPPTAAHWSYWYAPDHGTWTLSQAGATDRDAIPGGFEGWSFSLNHSAGDAPAPGVAPDRPVPPPPTTPPPTTPPPTTHRPPPTSQPPPTHPPRTHRPPTHPPPTRPPPTRRPPTRRPPTHQPPSHRPPPTHPATTHPGTGVWSTGGAGAGASTGSVTRPPSGGAPSGALTTQAPTTLGATGEGRPPPRGRPANGSPPGSTGNPVAVGHNAAGEKVSGALPVDASTPSGSQRSTVVGLGVVGLLGAGAAVAAWRRRASRG